MRLFPNSKKVKTNLLEEFRDKKILDLGCKKNRDFSKDCNIGCGVKHDLTKFPWPISDNSYDLIICQYVLENLPDIAKTLEEFNRIVKHGGKIFIETAHYTHEAHRRRHSHRFSLGSFDYFHKGNPYYKTDFALVEKYLFFDDLTFLLGIGFLANVFPQIYEKRLAFMFPATSFHVTFEVQK